MHFCKNKCELKIVKGVKWILKSHLDLNEEELDELAQEYIDMLK
jgi:hypothetical protein